MFSNQTLSHFRTQAMVVILLIFFTTLITTNAQTCNNSFPTTGNVSIHSGNAPKSLTIGGSTNCSDPAIQLFYQADANIIKGHLVLLEPSNLNLYSQLPVNTLGDLMLQSDASGNDIILTTRNENGHIRFATTELMSGNDIERLTITPKGKIGIGYNEPKNLFSVRVPMGLDYYQDDEGYQDFRFNCYQTEGTSKKDVGKIDSIEGKAGLKLPLTSGYVNIQPGYSGIIQTRNTAGWGSMLLAVNETNLNPDMDVDFFEHSELGGSMPKGIMIQNYSDPIIDNYAGIGIGAMPQPISRLTIQAFNTDNSMNTLQLLNYSGANMLKINNDGLVVIGEKTFTPETTDLDEDMLLSVDGAVVAKEVLVEITASKWADFVFNDDYKLPSLSELASYIKKNNKLPDIPSKNEIEKSGINLGKMQAKLLQKIEEMTLYLIQLKKENTNLNERIKILENKR